MRCGAVRGYGFEDFRTTAYDEMIRLSQKHYEEIRVSDALLLVVDAGGFVTAKRAKSVSWFRTIGSPSG